MPTDCNMSSNTDFSNIDSLSVTGLSNIQPPSFDSSSIDDPSLTNLPNISRNLDMDALSLADLPIKPNLEQSCFLQLVWLYWLKVQATAKIFRLPCKKPTLYNVVPFRPGNARAGEKQSTFPQLVWSYSEPERTTYICQDFNVSSRQVPSMPVRCRRFVPRPCDVLVDPCQAADGEIILVQKPPFACVLLPPRFPCLLTHSEMFFKVDIESPKMRRALEAYIKDSQPLLIEDILATVNDDIYILGLREAVRFDSEREVGVF
jgi:hypothetical protein